MMTVNIGAATNGPSTYFQYRLEGNGLSDAKAKKIEDDLVDAATRSLDRNPNESIDDLRAALDARIDQDVRNGTLSRDDAAKVRKTIDQIQAELDDAAALDGDDGGDDWDDDFAAMDGEGDAAKTEISRAETVSGGIRTIEISYSDGSTATEVSSVAAAGRQTYARSAASGTDGASAYLAQIPSGSLIDRAA